MSFNFGGGTGGTGGFSFASPVTSTSGTTGFSFASPTSTASGGTGGFTFNPPQAVQTTASAAGFTFNRPSATTTTAAAAGTGFSCANPPTTTTQSSSFGSLFAPTQTSVAATAPIGGFSLTSATPATTSAGGGFSFNVAPTAAVNSGTSSTPETGFSFSATTTTVCATPTTTAASLFNFASPKPLTGITPVASTAQGPSTSVSSTSGTLPSLFATPASQPQTSLPAATSLLGQAIAKAPSTSNVSSAATPSLPSVSTPLLAAAPATSTVSLTSTTATAAPLTTLSTATSTTSASGPIATGAMTASTPTLSVRGLEEKVNKWGSELREQEERLMRQAAHVNAWDQLLQQGHDQVQELRDTLNKVKVDQQRLQAELDFIQGQQQELEQLIEPLESAVASTTPAQHQGDRQRENMHHLAQNLHAQIHQITEDLCKVIEHLNSNNSGSQASDPVNTVARVLSAHMDTLKWVDQNCALISQKIDDLSRSVDSKHRD